MSGSTQPLGQMTAEDLRSEALLLRRRLQVARLRRATSVVESMAAGDWVEQYTALLDRYRDGNPAFTSMTTANDRRRGRNFPLFQTEQELALLRAPARILCGTNTYAQGMVGGLQCYVIGTGYSYRAVPKMGSKREPSPELLAACQEVLDEFGARVEWPEWELELFWRTREDGEYALRHFFTNEGLTEVRTVEPEQVTQPPGTNESDWSFGVRNPPGDTQTAEAYWVQYLDDGTGGEEVPASEMIHAKVNVKRAVKRGLTDFCFDALEGLETASKLRRNLGQGAAVQAAIAGIREHDTASQSQVAAFQQALVDYSAPNPGAGRQTDVFRAEPGMVLDMPKGSKYVPPPGAASADAHVGVLQACLRGAAVKWNAPEWLASADASNNNFASSLTAESPFVLRVLMAQRFYRGRFKRTHEIVLENAVRSGRLPAEALELVEVQCKAPSPQARNSLQEAQETKLWLGMGLLSPQTACDQQGLDFEQEQANRQQFIAKYGPIQAGDRPAEQPGQAPGSGEQSTPPGSAEGQTV